MAQRIVNLGTGPGIGNGDELRVAFEKVNQNFTELYTTVSGISSPVLSVVGRTGNIVLTINDIIGAIGSGYVEQLLQSRIVEVPASTVGKAGDTIGMMASDGTFFYFCFKNYDGTSNIWAKVPGDVSVAAVGNTLVKRDSAGNVFANKSYYSNRFTTAAELPPAAAHAGMLVYLDGVGFSASNGTEWVGGFGSGISTQNNGTTIGEIEKIKKINFTGSNIHVTVDQNDASRANISVDQTYSKTTTTTSATATVIDSFSVQSVKAAKYLVHVTTGSNIFFTEINVLNYGSDVDLTEYSSMGSVVDGLGNPVAPGEFSVALRNGQLELIFTPNSPSNTIRLNRYAILD